MFCSKCGNEIAADAIFCTKCGNQVKAPNSHASESMSSTEEVRLNNETNKKFNGITGSNKIIIAIAAVIILVVAIICIALFAHSNSGDSSTSSTSSQLENTSNVQNQTSENIQIENLALGNIVTLGNYEQDGNLENGAEPIEWDVIYENDYYFILLSHYILDATAYSVNRGTENWSVDGAWENSNVRSFLNDNFYNKAFTDNEKKIIEPSTGDGIITDNVFLLTPSELPLYFDVEEWGGPAPAMSSAPLYCGSSIVCGATPYISGVHSTKKRGELDAEGDNLDIFDIDKPSGRNTYYVENARPEYQHCAATWMLAPDSYQTSEDFAVYVSESGFVTSNAASIYTTLGIRPAIVIKKDNSDTSVTANSSGTSVSSDNNVVANNTVTNNADIANTPSYGSQPTPDDEYYVETYCTLQVNLTRENTTGDKLINGIAGIADALYGTNLVSGAQYDVGVFMDDELVDVIPYNEKMRDYSFVVEKGTYHNLEVYSLGDKTGHPGAETFKIKDNQVFAYQINTYSDGKVYLEKINSNARYDYEEDIELFATAAKLAAGAFVVYQIANETGIIDGFKTIGNGAQKWESDMENYYDRDLDAFRERQTQWEKDNAKRTYDELKKNDPYEESYLTKRAHEQFDALWNN